MRVAIFVTHLLGSGHLSRGLTLARAFASAGHDAHVVSGGRAVDNLETTNVTFHQLPPLASDGTNFTRLLDETGVVVGEAYRNHRKTIAIQKLRDIAPDVLITELYPFGRRVLREEFRAVLNAAKTMAPRPRIYASVRDILAPPSKPAKALETEAMVAAFYDGVLVHSDPSVTPLSASWPVTPSLQDKLLYTGFVAPPAPDFHPEEAGAGEVVVSAGGGDVGRSLFEAAVVAAAIDARPWRILVGGSDRVGEVRRLQAMSGDAPVTIEPARKDFRPMLRHARASVSMCGYNTAMDLLQTGCPSVLVPFDEGGEVEQTLRAEALARFGQFSILSSAKVTPERLARAVSGLPKRRAPDLATAFDGAARTVALVETAA